jgi:predicted DNA-binding protein (MmcQ/YjbR family)
MLSVHSSRYRVNIQRRLDGTAWSAPIAERNCYDARMLSEGAILRRLRTICLRLPGATEGLSFGHPTFRVQKKMFAVLEEYKGELGICLKVGKLLQGVFLDDPRFFRTPYIGQHGWVTLRAYAAPLDWNEVRELVKCSYDLVAPAKSRPRPKKKRKG